MNPSKPAAPFAFGPRNFRLMWIGVAVLAAGFITMMFGDKENYGEDFVGITLGPLLLVLGFAIEFAAIMVRDKSVAGPVALSVSSPAADVAPAGTVPATSAPAAPAAPGAPAYKRL